MVPVPDVRNAAYLICNHIEIMKSQSVAMELLQGTLELDTRWGKR
jgi:hypothetical protein